MEKELKKVRAKLVEMNSNDITYKRIRELRKLRGYSQDELAELVGYKSGRSMVSQIEHGRYDLPLDKVKTFARVLGVSVQYLTGIEDDMKMQDELLDKYTQLNEEGRKMALEYVTMLLGNPKYIKPSL